MTEKYRVMVVGCGYVGLVTGACLAHIGHQVVCVDKDEERVSALTEGRVPFYEPGFGEFLARSASRMHFTTELAPAVRGDWKAHGSGYGYVASKQQPILGY